MKTRTIAAALGTLLAVAALSAQAQDRTAWEAQTREGSTGVMTTARGSPAMRNQDRGMSGANRSGWYATTSGEASTMMNGQPNVLPLPMSGRDGMDARATRAMGAAASSDVAIRPSSGTPD